MALLTLRPDWPNGEFRRTVRGKHGETIKSLVFPKGHAVEIDDALLPLLAKEIESTALVPCSHDAKGRLRIHFQPEPPAAAPSDEFVDAAALPPIAAEAATDAPSDSDLPGQDRAKRRGKR